MHRRRKDAIGPVVLLLCALGSANCHAETTSEARAAAVLFKDFETVAYTTTDVPSDFFAPFPTNPNGSLVTLRLPFVLLVGGLHFLGPNVVPDLIRSYRAFLGGAKDFVPPRGLGMVISRECYIGLLKGPAQPDLTSDFRRAKSESIGGRRVWTWSMPPDDSDPNPTTFYAAQVGVSYFVLATNRDDFETTASELASAENSKPVSISVPGWTAFSAHKYWAHRSIRRPWFDKADRIATGLDTLSSDVFAFTFFADIDSAQSLVQVYTSDRKMKSVPEGIRESKLAHFYPAGAGIWEARIPLSNDPAASNDLAQVFYYLGFGVAA